MSELQEPVELASQYGRADCLAKVTTVAGIIGGIASIGLAYRALRDGYMPQDVRTLVISGSAMVASIGGPVAMHGYAGQVQEKLNATLPPSDQVGRQ